MNAVKIKMVENSTSKSVKAILAGAVVNALLVTVMTVLLSLFLTVSGNLFESFAGYLMLVPLIIGSYAGGFTAARINKSSGLLMGVLSSAIIFIVMLIVGFSTDNADITYMLLLKALAIFLPAAIGGVKGVNKKEKLKI